MAFSRNAGFTSAIATDPAATAAGYLTPTRYNLPHTVTDAVSGGIPYFSSTTAEGTSALLAANSVVLGGGAGQPPFTDSGLTYNATTDILTATGGFQGSNLTSGRVALAGASGLITDSANITYNTNGTITLGTQLVLPAGSSGTPSVKYSGDGRGFYFGNGAIVILNNAAVKIAASNSSGLGWQVGSDGILGFTGSGDATAASDAALSRTASGEITFGTGAQGNAGGTCRAAAYKVGSTAGASFGPGLPTSITIVNGIVTAAS